MKEAWKKKRVLRAFSAQSSLVPVGFGVVLALLFFVLLWLFSPAYASAGKAQTPPGPPLICPAGAVCKCGKRVRRKRRVRKKRRVRRRLKRRRRARRGRRWRRGRKSRRWRSKRNRVRRRKRLSRRSFQRQQRRMFRKVRRVSRYHTRVPQEVVRFYVGHMMRLSRQAIVEPFYDRGMSVGFRIAYLARRSIVRRLGFRLYDVIVGVNGYGVQTKAQAVLAYMALAQQKAFRVTLVRGGKRRVLRIDIR